MNRLNHQKDVFASMHFDSTDEKAINELIDSKKQEVCNIIKQSESYIVIVYSPKKLLPYQVRHYSTCGKVFKDMVGVLGKTIEQIIGGGNG